MLEDRLTPSAVFRWNATVDGANYYHASNWLILAGTAEEDYPTDGDEVFFQSIANGPMTEEGQPYASFDCYIPEVYAFSGIHLQCGYTGTESVQDTTSTGIL